MCSNSFYLRSSCVYLVLISLLIWHDVALALAQDYSCEIPSKTHIWISPLNPTSEKPLKIMAVSTDGAITELVLTDSQGHHIPLQSRYRGGPPWSILSALQKLDEGHFQVTANRNGETIACHQFTVGSTVTQPARGKWNLATEALYAAWIEELFGAPYEENLSFDSLEPVLRNRERNFLYNYHGRSEDKDLPLTPDCADLPYTLRAYFAWKMGLPFAYRTCGRGSIKSPPQCGNATIMSEFTRNISTQASFKKFSRLLVDTVHSGSLRTGFEDESTDWYPIAFNRETLWPGTIYADPYGHVLVLVEWIPQTIDQPGTLLVVDAQPDNSIARKRVWEGTLLYDHTESAGPGFKSFRPLTRTTAEKWRALTNEELTVQSEFLPFSLEQSQLARENFYAKLAKLINPHGLNPTQAYEATLDALVEQLVTRVNSVKNGEAYFRKNPRGVIPMPNRMAIFQTVGPWEDYSTPSRDMRLLIAINVLQSLPEKIIHYPELFVLNGKSPEQAKIEIEHHHNKRIHERSIVYTRSDGSTWELSLAEILVRKTAYEIAYNPNDCAEIRWGAQPDTEEYSTCRRQAPAQQRTKMELYRTWFRETQRPAY